MDASGLRVAELLAALSLGADLGLGHPTEHVLRQTYIALNDVMDVLWQPMYRDILVQQILPLAPGLVEKLENGTRVADVACGSGNGTLVMARRFPNSTFVGFDLDADAIAIARSRADGRTSRSR